MAAHPGQVITMENIAYLVGKAWPLAFTPINIMGGFKKSGAFPLNPGEIADRQVAPSLSVNPSCRKDSNQRDLGTSLSSSSSLDPLDSPCASDKSPSLPSPAQFSSYQEDLY